MISLIRWTSKLTCRQSFNCRRVMMSVFLRRPNGSCVGADVFYIGAGI